MTLTFLLDFIVIILSTCVLWKLVTSKFEDELMVGQGSLRLFLIWLFSYSAASALIKIGVALLLLL